MSIPDETLMAFADGELDAAARAEVESALRENPELARRVAQHVALRQRLRVAYSSELAEPVPQRLMDAARRMPSQSNNVVNLKDARDAKLRESSASGAKPARWRPAAAIAASVIIGFGLGYANRYQGSGSNPFQRGADGALTAGGPLATALSTQLAELQNAEAPVRLGISFLAKNGEYCRTFSLQGTVSPSGLACRHDAQWRIESLGQGGDATVDGYRTAATALSSETLHAVEQRIDGEALDAAGEAQALQRDWHK